MLNNSEAIITPEEEKSLEKSPLLTLDTLQAGEINFAETIIKAEATVANAKDGEINLCNYNNK